MTDTPQEKARETLAEAHLRISGVWADDEKQPRAWHSLAPELAYELRLALDREERLQAAIDCGPKTDGNDDSGYSTPQLVGFIRETATRAGVPAYRREELRQAADRLHALYSSYLAPCPHEVSALAGPGQKGDSDGK